MNQCIFCQSVYELEESNSTVPESLCCKECEQGFKEYAQAIDNWSKKENF